MRCSVVHEYYSIPLDEGSLGSCENGFLLCASVHWVPKVNNPKKYGGAIVLSEGAILGWFQTSANVQGALR